jgi:hypothetical protein
MALNRQSRTIADLERTVRAIATEFKTDSVFIIGSQAMLIGWPDAPLAMKISPEIDAFPANAKLWETQEKAKHPGESPEASEHINARFGEGSQFHETHGFYIDGVDENTAILPLADTGNRSQGRDRQPRCHCGRALSRGYYRLQARPLRREGPEVHRRLSRGEASRPGGHRETDTIKPDGSRRCR